jgi:hypothetical protein
MKRTVLIATAALAAACSDTTAPEGRKIYEVEVTGERFRIALDDARSIAIADSLLAAEAPNNIHGTLKRGDGGFNTGYSWHLDPATVTFPDLTMEICDGRPRSDVEMDTDYWFSTVKYYCPWGAQIVARIE